MMNFPLTEKALGKLTKSIEGLEKANFLLCEKLTKSIPKIVPISEMPINKIKNKEVKEMKPYLEVKVVKVKKEKKCEHHLLQCNSCKKYLNNVNIMADDEIQFIKKGNWVNGENLDKIKFPCFCSYMDGEVKKIGMLNRVFFRGEYFYLITDCSQQYADSNGEQFYHQSNLKTMFERYNIHILKAKIIIYEEE